MKPTQLALLFLSLASTPALAGEKSTGTVIQYHPVRLATVSIDTRTQMIKGTFVQDLSCEGNPHSIRISAEAEEILSISAYKKAKVTLKIQDAETLVKTGPCLVDASLKTMVFEGSYGPALSDALAELRLQGETVDVQLEAPALATTIVTPADAGYTVGK